MAAIPRLALHLLIGLLSYGVGAPMHVDILQQGVPVLRVEVTSTRGTGQGPALYRVREAAWPLVGSTGAAGPGGEPGDALALPLRIEQSTIDATNFLVYAPQGPSLFEARRIMTALAEAGPGRDAVAVLAAPDGTNDGESAVLLFRGERVIVSAPASGLMLIVSPAPVGR